MRPLRGYIIFTLGVVMIFGGLSIIVISLLNIFSSLLKYIGFILTLIGIYLFYLTKKESLTVIEIFNFLQTYGFEVEKEIQRALGVFFGTGPESWIGKIDGVLVCIDVWWMMKDKDWPSKIKIYLTVPVRRKKLGVVVVDGNTVRVPKVYKKYTDEWDLEVFKALAAEFKDARAKFFYNHNFLWMVVDIEAVEGKKAINIIKSSIDMFTRLSKIFKADTEFYKKINKKKYQYKELELIKSIEMLDSKIYVTATLFLLFIPLVYLTVEDAVKYVIIGGIISISAIILLGYQFNRRKSMKKWIVGTKMF